VKPVRASAPAGAETVRASLELANVMRRTSTLPVSGARWGLAPGLFGLLSLADLLLTGWLLQRPEQSVYEANPLASGVLALWGWPGMVALKLAAVLVACGAGLLLFRRRPRAGKGVFVFGCGITGVVVLWSGCLALGLEESDSRLFSAERIRAEAETLELKRVQAVEYHECLDRIAEDLAGSSCTLAEGVERLAGTSQGSDPSWQQTLRCIYPAKTDRECLAINIIRLTLDLVSGRSDTERLSERLAGEYRRLFGRELPQQDPSEPVPDEIVTCDLSAVMSFLEEGPEEEGPEVIRLAPQTRLRRVRGRFAPRSRRPR
jgi:hypothetical protein